MSDQPYDPWYDYMFGDAPDPGAPQTQPEPREKCAVPGCNSVRPQRRPRIFDWMFDAPLDDGAHTEGAWYCNTCVSWRRNRPDDWPAYLAALAEPKEQVQVPAPGGGLTIDVHATYDRVNLRLWEEMEKYLNKHARFEEWCREQGR